MEGMWFGREVSWVKEQSDKMGGEEMEEGGKEKSKGTEVREGT